MADTIPRGIDASGGDGGIVTRSVRDDPGLVIVGMAVHNTTQTQVVPGNTARICRDGCLTCEVFAGGLHCYLVKG